MIAVGCRDVTTPPSRLKIVLAHQPPDLLVIDDHSSMPQPGAHASPAVEFELIADRRDRLDDGSVVMRGDRMVVEDRAGNSHQPASFCDAEARGPTMTDVFALFGRGCASHSPLYKLELQRLLADEPFQRRRDPGFILLKKIRRGRVFVKDAGLVLLNPDPDQV
jgi:hypothetical protein